MCKDGRNKDHERLISMSENFAINISELNTVQRVGDRSCAHYRGGTKQKGCFNDAESHGV